MHRRVTIHRFQWYVKDTDITEKKTLSSQTIRSFRSIGEARLKTSPQPIADEQNLACQSNRSL